MGLVVFSVVLTLVFASLSATSVPFKWERYAIKSIRQKRLADNCVEDRALSTYHDRQSLL